MASVNAKQGTTGRKRRKPKVKKKSMEFKKGSWEQQRERQKLASQLKIDQDLLEKERKKVNSKRLEVQKKRRLYLKEKELNDKLTIKYATEKELWLERKKKRGHTFNKQFLMNKVAEKIKEWEMKAEEAIQEWINIRTEKAEMKELEVSLERDQDQLKIDREKFALRKTDFEEKSKDVDEVRRENEEEQARLKLLEDPLIEEERKLDQRIKKYEAHDCLVKGRETLASRKDTEQNKEGLRLKNVKQKLLATLGQRKAGFNDQSIQLDDNVTKVDVLFAELFNDFGENFDEPDAAIAFGVNNDEEAIIEHEETEL